MVVRRIIIGSAAEYEKWVRSKFCFGKMFVKSLISVFLKAEAESNFLVFTALYYFYAPLYHFSFLISHS